VLRTNPNRGEARDESGEGVLGRTGAQGKRSEAIASPRKSRLLHFRRFALQITLLHNGPNRVENAVGANENKARRGPLGKSRVEATLARGKEADLRFEGRADALKLAD